MAELVPLRWNTDKRSYYNPNDLINRKNATLQDLKNEYTRMRDIARKRINRLEQQNLITQKQAQKYRDMFPKIAELTGNIKIKDVPEEFRPFIENNVRNRIAGALSDVSRLLNVEASTIPKAKEKKEKYMSDLKKQLKKWGLSEDLATGVNAMRMWEFFQETKTIVGQNIFYSTKAQRKLLFSKKALINKINNGEYGDVVGALSNAGKAK